MSSPQAMRVASGDQVGVPAEKTRIIFVDNRAAELDRPLDGGEQVGVFPAIGGG